MIETTEEKRKLGLVIFAVMLLSMFVSKGSAQWENPVDPRPWEIPDSNVPIGPSVSEMLLYAGVIILVVIVCIGLLTNKKRKKSEEAKEIIVEKPATRILVICPFCGAKTEQGIALCWNCGAKLLEEQFFAFKFV